jgi:hypothetical protein
VAESYASIEVCNMIERTKPIVTHVSVLKTQASNGKYLFAMVKTHFNG